MSILKSLEPAIISLSSVLRLFLLDDNVRGKEKIPLLACDKDCLPKELDRFGIRGL